MAVSKGLKDLAKKLQEDADVIMAEAEHNPSLFNYVTETIATASLNIEKAAAELEGKEPVNTVELLETIAGLAQALDETGDDILIKKASLLDELLVTISAPKSAVLQAKTAGDEEIDKLRAKYRTETREKLYSGVGDKLDEQARKAEITKAVKEQVKEYRPLEAPLMTRYCPDHPGVGVTRVADRVYQCGLDKKLYNWEVGFTTEKGNKIPGGGVEYQNKDWGNRGEGHTMFDTRQSLMSRYASVQEGLVKIASEMGSDVPKTVQLAIQAMTDEADLLMSLNGYISDYIAAKKSGDGAESGALRHTIKAYVQALPGSDNEVKKLLGAALSDLGIDGVVRTAQSYYDEMIHTEDPSSDSHLDPYDKIMSDITSIVTAYETETLTPQECVDKIEEVINQLNESTDIAKADDKPLVNIKIKTKEPNLIDIATKYNNLTKSAQASSFKVDKLNKKIYVNNVPPHITDEQKKIISDNIAGTYGDIYSDYEIVYNPSQQ